MIRKIILKNFLSYESAEAEFDGSTIAVVGDNGAGKSAFLEAIPYAYFGIGRETKEGMSRIKGDGSHRVEIWESDDIIIKRGRKANGAGYAEVRVAGELVGKGKEADVWIADHLGMSADVYMLTAFFGLSDSHSDKLLRVLPSARLEALQRLAQVGPYRTLLKNAKAAYDAAERGYGIANARMEGAQSAIVDEEKLQDGLSAGHKLVGDMDEQIKELKEKRHNLQIEEEGYRAFVKEKERVSTERQALRREQTRLENEKDTMYEEIASTSQAVRENISEVKKITDKLSKIDVDQLLSEGNEVEMEKAHATVEAELKKTALSTEDEDISVCPLCKQPVSEDIIAEWEESWQTLQETLKELDARSVQIGNDLERADDLKGRVTGIERENKALVEDTKKAEKRVKIVEHELSKLTSEIKKKDDRFVFLVEKLGEEYQGLQANIEEVSNELDSRNQIKHTALGEMKQVKETLERNKAARAIILDEKKAMKKFRLDMAAANLLKQAWNRYGIPLRLLERLNSRIEERASAVYQEFDNGCIEVREVEDRGKPGIQFCLVDRKGDRTFGQLSMGEKVMFFIAIRVAIAQIVAEDSPITVDYLVLDEAMGNLSPKRRDDLVRLINKVLRKIFPQVIMVSHTEMRDIFSQTIRVTAENDVSCVEVA